MLQTDPYSTDQGHPVRDALTSPLRPSTYLNLYKTWPLLYGGGLNPWNVNKGLWMPFVGKDWERTGSITGAFTRLQRKIRLLYGKNNPLQASLSLLGSTTKNVLTLGHSTGGYVGKKFFDKKPSYNKESLEDINKLRKKYRVQSVDDTRGVKQLNKLGQKVADIRKDTWNAVNIAKKERVWATRSLALQKGVFRWGMRLGKAASFIGLASFAWDIASMIGEPLGRTAMGAVDSVMTDYQNRFMPEIGGRLKASYLSQNSATERQRALQALNNSSLNGRSAFGSEAQLSHQEY